MLKKILIGLAVIAVALALYINSRPDDWRVTRSMEMAATPATIFPHINSLQSFNEWSPWAKLDPTAKYEQSGPKEGVGATLAWDGNMEVGKGKMTITESKPNELVGMNLVFEKPMAGTSDVDFALTPTATGTKVTWSMESKANFLSKTMSLVMDCDKMCGDQFIQGLTNLKNTVEAKAAAPKLTQSAQ